MSDCTIERIPAYADLSSSQYLVVYSDSGAERARLCTTDGGNSTILGLLQDANASAAGEMAQVVTKGYAWGIASEALEPDDFVTCDTAGKLRKVDSCGDYILGRYAPQYSSSGSVRPDAAANDRIRVLLFDDKARRNIGQNSKVINFASIATLRDASDTITVTGAATGDYAFVNPNAQITAGTADLGVHIYAYVSAADTVTVVAVNPTAGAIDLASNTYLVTVIKAGTMLS